MRSVKSSDFHDCLESLCYERMIYEEDPSYVVVLPLFVS